jgi:hypothetical protein
LASYFEKPVFDTRDEFLTYRNQGYDDFYGALEFMPEEILIENKGKELSEVEPVIKVLNRLQNDGAKNLSVNPAPWTESVFRAPELPASMPLDKVGMKKRIDANFAYLAEQSDSKRFIVRSGGRSGHFQTLVYEPEKNAQAPWTLLNSSSNFPENTLIPQVISGASPAELLGAHTDRGLVLGIWTQSRNPAANVGYENLMNWTPPNAVQDDEFEAV